MGKFLSSLWREVRIVLLKHILAPLVEIATRTKARRIRRYAWSLALTRPRPRQVVFPPQEIPQDTGPEGR